MPSWVEAGCTEYGKRMPPELRIETIEIALGARGKNQPASKAIEKESQALLKAIGLPGLCGCSGCDRANPKHRKTGE